MSWNITGFEMLDLFQGTFGQSVCGLVICLFLPFFLLYIRSKPTGGRLLCCSHGNCPRKAKSVWWRRRRKKRKTLHLPLEGQLFGWAWAVSTLPSVFYFLTDLWLIKLNQNKKWILYMGPPVRQDGPHLFPLEASLQMDWAKRRQVMGVEVTGHRLGTKELSHLPVRTAPFQTPALALRCSHHRWTAFRKVLVMPGLQYSDTRRATLSGCHERKATKWR